VWQESGLRPLNISVNVSPIQLRRPDFVQTVEAVLERTGFDAARLELEITEGALMEGAEQCAALLNDLRRLGITIAVDDFGTGYSSLNYLKKFRVDRIKIDQTFVRDIGVDDDNEAITRAIIALAKALHFRVIAEGVETATQRSFLLEHGCADAQGLFYSAAVEPDAIAAMLEGAARLPAALCAIEGDPVRGAGGAAPLRNSSQTVT
jgi:EAL domain-containing protein (putative c-di-GMP-specific phosphodiesterase class I)